MHFLLDSHAHPPVVYVQYKANSLQWLTLKTIKKGEPMAHYCDCSLSTYFKTPNEVPDNVDPVTLDRVSHFTPVPTDAQNCCLFCGHHTFYSEKKLKTTSSARDKVVYKKQQSQKPKAVEARKLYYEKKAKKAASLPPQNENLPDLIKRLVKQSPLCHD